MYSVLRYSPSRISGEHIKIGIIFDAPEDQYREFRYIKKFSRLSAFDDELNIENTKILLRGIKEDVEGSIFTYDAFDIEKYVEFFINDFSFERPKQISYDTLDEVLETVHKSYFRFEYEITQRPSVADDTKLLYRILKESGKKAKRKSSLAGAFDEQVTYDIITDDFKIKVFDFDNKDLSKLINSAKVWAWNGMHNVGQKLIIIYRYSNLDQSQSDNFETILRILQDSGAEVLDIDAGLTLLSA